MKNLELRKLLDTLLLLFFLSVLVDRGGGYVMRIIHEHSDDVTAPKLRSIASTVDAEVIIMGTSRANCHYIPRIMEPRIGKSVYNAGIDGSKNIYAHYFALCLLLGHHIPDVICLELMSADYRPQQDSFSGLSFFAPYIGYSDDADSLFRVAGKYSLYRLSHLYRFNSKSVSNIAGSIKRKTQDEKGFIPSPDGMIHDRLICSDEDNPKDGKFEIDSLKLEYLSKFADRCAEKGVKLIFTMSPAYTVADTALYTPIKKLAAEKSIPVMDYHTAGLFHDHPEYFHDLRHLNIPGAKAYSQVFAEDLRKIIGGLRSTSR